MATLDSTGRSSLTGFLLTGQTLLMATFTLVETLALGLWLTLVVDAQLLSVASALGILVLTVGLVVEHIRADASVNGLSLSCPVKRSVGISVSEAFLWVLWLGVSESIGGVTGIIVAGVLLAVLLVPQHTIEDNILRGEEPFSSVVSLGTVGFSVVESVGATLWLLFVFEGRLFAGLLDAAGLSSIDPGAVGLGLLAVVLFIEHDIGLALARRS
jgi:hypothetical protein